MTDDRIDDVIASCVCVSWFPHPLWHQDQASTVSGGLEKGLVQEKTTQQDNQVGKKKKQRMKIARLAKALSVMMALPTFEVNGQQALRQELRAFVGFMDVLMQPSFQMESRVN